MFKKLLVTGIVLAWSTFPLNAKAEEHPLVGKVHPPLLEITEDRGGWSIEAPYTVKEVFIDKQRLLLLNRVIEKDNKGIPTFQVVEVLTLPTITETEEISGGDCFVNGQKERNFIAIMKSNDNTPFLTKARKAWRVEGEKFNEVDVTRLRVKCENYSYGL